MAQIAQKQRWAADGTLARMQEAVIKRRPRWPAGAQPGRRPEATQPGSDSSRLRILALGVRWPIGPLTFAVTRPADPHWLGAARRTWLESTWSKERRIRMAKYMSMIAAYVAIGAALAIAHESHGRGVLTWPDGSPFEEDYPAGPR